MLAVFFSCPGTFCRAVRVLIKWPFTRSACDALADFCITAMYTMIDAEESLTDVVVRRKVCRKEVYGFESTRDAKYARR